MQRKGPTPKPMLDRFWGHVDTGERCLMWLAGKNNHGYGWFTTRRGNKELAHRVAWEVANGEPIPSGMFVLHSCDTPACVNPEHLRLGTAADNMRDVRTRRRHPGARKLFCKHGHALDAANTYFRPGGGRDCRACLRRRRSAYQARRMEVA